MTEHRCRYDESGNMVDPYPWSILISEGDMVRIEQCRRIKSLRISAVQWGSRSGGILQVEDMGEGTAIVTLRRAGMDKETSRYAPLDDLRPGEECIIPWLTDRQGRRQQHQHAIYQAIKRRFKGRRFYTSSTARGLSVYLCP